jgi:biopolymer transport protein TolQ
MFVANSLFSLILQSDGITQCVLVLLLIMSTMCWSTYIYHFFVMRACRKDIKRLLKHVVTSGGWLQYQQSAACDTRMPLMKKMYQQTVQTLTRWDEMIGQNSAITQADWQYLDNCWGTIYEDVRVKMASGMSILMLCAESAPLLGLFGTVWGLIHAFMRIAQLQSADIATVAPGIAEALITTLAGLLVALPALAMFHMLNTRYKVLMSLVGRQLDGCARLAHLMARESVHQHEVVHKDKYGQANSLSTV